MTEHEAADFGAVQTRGYEGNGSPEEERLQGIAKKIETHGEAHAAFTGIEDEVELRLGTTVVDFNEHAVHVWDGDHYRTFPIENLEYVYKPMEVFH